MNTNLQVDNGANDNGANQNPNAGNTAMTMAINTGPKQINTQNPW